MLLTCCPFHSSRLCNRDTPGSNPKMCRLIPLGEPFVPSICSSLRAHWPQGSACCWERNEAPLPLSQPKKQLIHTKQLSPLPERLKLPFSNEEILPMYEDFVSSGTDQEQTLLQPWFDIWSMFKKTPQIFARPLTRDTIHLLRSFTQEKVGVDLPGWGWGWPSFLVSGLTVPLPPTFIFPDQGPGKYGRLFIRSFHLVNLFIF